MAKDFPNFTDAQVAALEELFPPKCLARGELVEDHLRYSGKVDLISIMRAHVIQGPDGLLELSDEEEDALVVEVGGAEPSETGDED